MNKSKKPGIRAIENAAFANAAALIESMDFVQLYADFALEHGDDPEVDSNFDRAQRTVVEYLRRRVHTKFPLALREDS